VAALNHPPICVLHDIGCHEGIDYLVMEYLEGETLAGRLTKGALPFEQTITYAIEIAGALDKAHRASVGRDRRVEIVFSRSDSSILAVMALQRERRLIESIDEPTIGAYAAVLGKTGLRKLEGRKV